VLLIALALAQTPPQTPEQAWVEGDIATASTGWADRIDAGEVSGDLYYNLGNALVVQGRSPEAVLAYRRAQLLSPRDGDIHANLDHARRDTRDRIEAAPPLNPLSPREQGLLAAVMFAAAGLIATRSRPAAAVLTIPGVVAVVGTWLQISAFGSSAVVLADAEVRSAGGGGVALFELHPGAEVALEQQVGDMSQVALPDGRRGWMPSAALGVIDPRLPAPR
jgi:hypothetical protein